MNGKDLFLKLPKHYPSREVEAKWRAFWEQEALFAFDRNARPEELFSVDTPPPTVSGDLHIGHVFSYTHQDFIVRYKRMRGFKIYYPFGFDDNGLPTERLVERTKGVKGAETTRENFWNYCLEVSAEQEQRFKALWQDVGLSVDWNEVYSTIDERSRRISQRSFLDLLRKGEVYRKEAPTLWCTECKTAIAQAEVEDRHEEGEFHKILFLTEEGETVAIATTRPELLPACVAVFFYPGDSRYKHLRGRTLKTPYFNIRVPVFEDRRVDPQKGTGIVMCCTFGDTVDIEWWQEYNLQTRIAIDEKGQVNELAEAFAGLPLREARRRIVQKLREDGLLTETEKITHTLSAHERCGTPLEFLVNKQWFIKVLDKKEELIAFGEKCRWFPPHMFARYRHWVENLKWDWCISRQRYFGVPFPLWYCGKCDEVIPARESDLPVNPLTDKAPLDECPKCHARDIVPERDVLDTWATSSLTPQINAKWGEKDDRMAQMFPMSLRPQAHDIIRTWAFYTIVKAYLHFREVPWHDIVISGHALDSSRVKISKSKSETISPKTIIEKFSADVVRHWAGETRLGTDTFINLAEPTKSFANGKRFITKLYNASKLAHLHLVDFSPVGLELSRDVHHPLDRWLIGKLGKVVQGATIAFENYEFAEALDVTESFFWSDFCDNYMELAKGRLYGDALKNKSEEERKILHTSARLALFAALETILKLVAPFVPFIAEEIWSWYFRNFSDKKSIHLTDWPRFSSFEGVCDDMSARTAEVLIEALTLIRKAKSELKVSVKKIANRLTIGFSRPEKVDGTIGQMLQLVQDDLLTTGNVKELVFVNNVLDEGVELDPPRLKAKLEMPEE